jgi:hypothetical protein
MQVCVVQRGLPGILYAGFEMIGASDVVGYGTVATYPVERGAGHEDRKVSPLGECSPCSCSHAMSLFHNRP